MNAELLNTTEAARRLGISRATFYQWLADSDSGTFALQGRPVSIQYFQGGRRGQGRIQIEATELARLRKLMQVRPRHIRQRRPPQKRHAYPGITVELGDPGD